MLRMSSRQIVNLQGDELSSGGNHAAGELQLLLYHHLHKCPNAIVQIQNLGQIHADLLTVLLAVLSEQVKILILSLANWFLTNLESLAHCNILQA